MDTTVDSSRILVLGINASLNDRLSIPPIPRISLATFTAFSSLSLAGLATGYQSAGYKFLAHNSHRLPSTKAGWFEYHRRKSYYCIKEGMIHGFKTGVKTGFFIGLVFSIEATMDRLRGVVDFGNTMMATSVAGFLYASTHSMKKVQARDYILKGGYYGIILGLSQDFLQFVKGADVWYLSKYFNVHPMPLSQRLQSS